MIVQRLKRWTVHVNDCAETEWTESKIMWMWMTADSEWVVCECEWLQTVNGWYVSVNDCADSEWVVCKCEWLCRQWMGVCECAQLFKMSAEVENDDKRKLKTTATKVCQPQLAGICCFVHSHETFNQDLIWQCIYVDFPSAMYVDSSVCKFCVPFPWPLPSGM